MKLRQRRHRGAGLHRDTRGAAAVEFAIVVPLLALLVLGLVDYGTGWWEAMMVGNAARAGAYYAAVNGWASGSTTNDPGIDAAVASATQLTVTASSAEQCYCPTSSGLVASGTPPNCSQTLCPDGVTVAGCYAQVNAQALYSPLVPFSLTGLWLGYSVSSNAITLKATAYGRFC